MVEVWQEVWKKDRLWRIETAPCREKMYHFEAVAKHRRSIGEDGQEIRINCDDLAMLIVHDA